MDHNKHILGPDTGTLPQKLGEAFEHRLFLLGGAGVEDGDLDIDQVIAPLDIKSMAIAEIGRLMFGDGHKLIIQRDVEGLPKGLIQAVKDSLPIGV